MKKRSIPASVYSFVFPQYRDEMQHLLRGKGALLDVGCGRESPLELVSHDYRTTGIDLNADWIAESQAAGIHDKYIVGDIRNLKTMGLPKYDVVMCTGVIEHVTKPSGRLLLEALEGASNGIVIVYTTNGFVPQPDKNPLNRHRSGWTPEDFEQQGYTV